MTRSRSDRNSRPERWPGAVAGPPPAHRTESDACPADARVSSLSERAYLEIKDRILRAVFLPGQYLVEAAICDLLKLGRTPVHQALQRLQIEGLVEVVPRKGVIVRPCAIDVAADALDARGVVERALVSRAIARATAADLADLAGILETAGRGPGGDSVEAFVDSDRAFHVRIAMLSGNAVLADIVRVLHEQASRVWYRHQGQSSSLVDTTRQNRAILDALAARDPEQAADAVRRYIDAVDERLQLLGRQTPSRRGRADPKAGGARAPHSG